MQSISELGFESASSKNAIAVTRSSEINYTQLQQIRKRVPPLLFPVGTQPSNLQGRSCPVQVEIEIPVYGRDWQIPWDMNDMSPIEVGD
ncbi:hypothetical protein J0A67_08535 [Algoriphagus aestuariicola]|uniref:Uncharacterized protein n=1 Tax=Algoriphagus aestuariicola TaxID=1852016 RepID=A0ABS3BNM7_9BACT|nr:hypothetical protein [Algoriphagus aestuariicola]MBN7800904.1 hypothetical protein [Algoriphagus aestuariicola]